MASTQPPRPRPRPRPVPRAKAPPSSPGTSNNDAVPTDAVDDDSLFMRNRGRSAKVWTKLKKITAETKKKVASSDSEGEQSESMRPRKQKKLSGESTRLARLISETQSSDSDSGSDVVVTGGSTSKRKAKGKERARSKSRSLTPPPEMSREQRDLLRNIVRETLGARDRDRTPSPPLDPDLSTDTIVFDPEVQAIINAANAGAKPSESNPISHSNETIEISVHWKPHPRDEQGRKRTDIFKLNRTDTFREMFEAVAEDQSLLPENLRLSHNNIRIFPSVTPATLRIWDEADLEACDKTTWEFLHANSHKAGHSGSAIEIASDSEEEEEDEELLQSDAGDDDDETLKLVLRSSKTVGNDITLTVRPTTTCGAIVQAFLKKAGLADQYGKPAGSTTKKGRGRKSAVASDKNPQLSIDGDRIDHGVPISEMDLDSGDVVDVVGL